MFAFYSLVISLVCDITSYVMNVHLELLLYSFSVVCRGHFMKYYDHYILAQGGIHNITAFAVAFNNFFGSHLPACLVSTSFVAFDTCRLLYSPQNRTVFQASFQVPKFCFSFSMH